MGLSRAGRRQPNPELDNGSLEVAERIASRSQQTDQHGAAHQHTVARGLGGRHVSTNPVVMSSRVVMPQQTLAR